MWLSESGQSSAMRMAMRSATAAQSADVRIARGQMRATAAAARMPGRTNHGPIGLSSSAIAVKRSDVSRWDGQGLSRNKPAAVIFGGNTAKGKGHSLLPFPVSLSLYLITLLTVTRSIGSDP